MLVTISSFTVEGSTILVPQRVDPESRQTEQQSPVPRGAAPSRLSEGATAFIESIDRAPEQHRANLHRLCAWAQSLEQRGFAKLWSFEGSGRWTLLPRLVADNVGLVTIWNDNGAYLSLWRGVFERRAPTNLPVIEKMIAPIQLGQGKSVYDLSDSLLQALTEAYREAASGKVTR